MGVSGCIPGKACTDQIYHVIPGRLGAFYLVLSPVLSATLPEGVVSELSVGGLAHLRTCPQTQGHALADSTSTPLLLFFLLLLVLFLFLFLFWLYRAISLLSTSRIFFLLIRGWVLTLFLKQPLSLSASFCFLASDVLVDSHS